jgi:hypothetical protein
MHANEVQHLRVLRALSAKRWEAIVRAAERALLLDADNAAIVQPLTKPIPDLWTIQPGANG